MRYVRIAIMLVLAGSVGLALAALPANSAQKAPDKKPADKKPADKKPAEPAKPAPAPAPAPAPPEQKPGGITDEEVSRAIEKGREYLIGLANPDGSFRGSGESGAGGTSALVFMTLAYMGEHPTNRPYMAKGLDFLLNAGDRDFGDRQGYGVPIRVMGLSYVHNKLLSDKRALVRQKMKEDIMRFQLGQLQGGEWAGGWRYRLDPSQDHDIDFSVTQWPILAMREANLVGVEFDWKSVLEKAQKLYFKFHHPDGGWHYQKDPRSYGSMTAAGVASLFIIDDVLDPASGCPCSGGKSQLKVSEAERHMESGLGWLGKNFSSGGNPNSDTTPGSGRNLYWLYCVERVGIAAGYKYFGDHNWYREGAEHVVRAQQDGHWGSVSDTCFALLFLYKGRAPILFNKLKFDGVWNAHRRDMANLTGYIEHTKEQQFHWQIVELKKSPLQELHDAPILYICAEQVKDDSFGDADKKKLRDFTDTGGTILFEASCGNPGIRKWFQDFAREVWPEWPMKALGPDHGVFTDPNPLKQRPEILGVGDGVRTSVFYAMDDVSCAWQQRAMANKDYLFKWGINLYTYATDGAALRAKLANPDAKKSDRYKAPVKGGGKSTIKIARMKHGGNWESGANYGGFGLLAKYVKDKAAITLDLKEPAAPFNKGGVEAKDLAGNDVAFITGSNAFQLSAEEKEALKTFVEKGGALWLEASTGANAFDQSLQKLAADMQWQVKLLQKDNPLATGRLDPGLGYDLTQKVEFSTWFRKQRLGRTGADIYGVFQGDKMIGVYSPLDVIFSITGHEAWHTRGYQEEDAAAVGTNIAIYFSTLK